MENVHTDVKMIGIFLPFDINIWVTHLSPFMFVCVPVG